MDVNALIQAWPALTVVASAGAAWGAVKHSLNGTRERVSKIETALADHAEKDDQLQNDTIDRLARIETKLDVIADRRRKR